MKYKKHLFLAALALFVSLLSGCATGYQQMTAFTITGGYDQEDLGQDVFRVCFGGNGFTTRETAQCYFLNRCAEIALENGFQGFEIISDIRLTDVQSPSKAFGVEEQPFETVQYIPIYIPTIETYKPYLEADIHLLKGPINAKPPKVFDAQKLIDALKPYIDPAKGGSNVKPHIHEYLLPEGKLNGTTSL